MNSESKETRPEEKTWAWCDILNKPVFILGAMELMDRPIVAAPYIVFETDGIGLDQLSSTIITMPVPWSSLSAIETNPRELDY